MGTFGAVTVCVPRARLATLEGGTKEWRNASIPAYQRLVRVKASYLRALFQRLKARRGPRKAIVAVAAAMLTAIYHMLKRGAAYHDLGPDHFQRTERPRLAARLARWHFDAGVAWVRRIGPGPSRGPALLHHSLGHDRRPPGRTSARPACHRGPRARPAGRTAS